MLHQPFRSVLYIPGSKKRALEKAKTLAVDAIIFDLEDAVSISEKTTARVQLADFLINNDFGPRYKIARINDLSTPWGGDDLAVLAKASPDAVLLPKVDTAADIQALDTAMSGHPGFENTQIWAMMETPLGILNAAEIAQAPRMAGMVMGTNDLAKDLGALNDPTRAAMQTSLGLCLLAAKAYGITIVDGVYNAFKDADGLRVEATQGRMMGFDGKTLIHPAQVEVSNEVFAPTQADLDLAQSQIAAFAGAEARGEGVAVVNGQIVENLHVETAKTLLAKAAIIEKLNGEL